MRKILFRGKRKDNGEWVYGFYVFFKKRKGIFGQVVTERDFDRHIICALSGEETDVIPETVGEYTGLTDKNGKKIFEGDIVRYEDGIGYVSWGDCASAFVCIAQNGKYWESYSPMGDIEVIGNIHDNPELLGVKK